MTRALLSLAALSLLAWTPAARANPPVTLTLDQAAPTVAPGGTFQFTGTVADPFGGTLSLGGDSLNPIGTWPAGLTADDTPFQMGAPQTITSGTSYSGGLFDVSVARGTAPGTYGGTFQVEYDDSSGNPDFASQGFQIKVPAPVPEASSAVSLGLLLCFGLSGAVVARKKAKA